MKIFLSENLNFLLSKNNLSQSDFANIIGVGQSNVNVWAKGKSFPKMEILLRICDYFKVDVGEFITMDISKKGYSAHEEEAPYLTKLSEDEIENQRLFVHYNWDALFKEGVLKLHLDKLVAQGVSQRLEDIVRMQHGKKAK